MPGVGGTWERVRGGIAAVACGAVLVGLTAGCARTVSGTPYAEGESPPAASAGTAAGDAPASGVEPGTSATRTPSPPTSFSVPGALPSGRPTVTVAPVPGTPTTRYPMPFDDPPSGLQAPPAPTLLAAPDAPGGSSRTVVPRRSRAGGADTAAPKPATPDRARPGATAPAPSPGGAGPLTADVVPDECLLDATGFGALLGATVPTPANHVVSRPGGATTRSCFAVATSGAPAPTASVNVYRVNTGAPAAFLRTATGSRPLAGIGDGAVLVDTLGGPTLQIATPRLLVTVAVAGRAPSDDAWRAAGRAAVARLPGR